MQDYLDPKLIDRLLRPIERPGVIDTGMGWEIVRRSQQFTNRLPLLSHLTQRWNRKIGFQGDQIPIVYAQPQPQETSTTRSISEELGQSPSSQRTVVQAKFVSGSGANRLMQKTNSLAGETPTPQEFLTTNPSHQTTVVQAKFLPGSGANRLIEKTNDLAGETPTPQEFLATNPSSQTTVVQAKFLPGSGANRLIKKTNDLAGETPTPQEFLATNPSSQTTVVQAKFLPGSDRALLSPKPTPIGTTTLPIEPSLNLNSPNLSLETKAINIERQLEGLSGETIQNPRPIVQVRSQPLPASDRIISPGANSPIVVESSGEAIAQRGVSCIAKQPVKITIPETTQNSKSQVQNPIGWSGFKTPLVFSSPAVKTESVQTELAVPNPDTGISITEPMTRTTGLSREVSPNIQSNGESNIQQPHKQDSSNNQNPIDLEVLTDKIERKLMQRLIIESERRGRTTWS